jgi:hypothetical protein
VSGIGTLVDLAVDDANVYWAEYANPGAVMKAPK